MQNVNHIKHTRQQHSPTNNGPSKRLKIDESKFLDLNCAGSINCNCGKHSINSSEIRYDLDFGNAHFQSISNQKHLHARAFEAAETAVGQEAVKYVMQLGFPLQNILDALLKIPDRELIVTREVYVNRIVDILLTPQTAPTQTTSGLPSSTQLVQSPVKNPYFSPPTLSSSSTQISTQPTNVQRTGAPLATVNNNIPHSSNNLSTSSTRQPIVISSPPPQSQEGSKPNPVVLISPVKSEPKVVPLYTRTPPKRKVPEQQSSNFPTEPSTNIFESVMPHSKQTSKPAQQPTSPLPSKPVTQPNAKDANGKNIQQQQQVSGTKENQLGSSKPTTTQEQKPLLNNVAPSNQPPSNVPVITPSRSHRGSVWRPPEKPPVVAPAPAVQLIQPPQPKPPAVSVAPVVPPTVAAPSSTIIPRHRNRKKKKLTPAEIFKNVSPPHLNQLLKDPRGIRDYRDLDTPVEQSVQIDYQFKRKVSIPSVPPSKPPSSPKKRETTPKKSPGKFPVQASATLETSAATRNLLHLFEKRPEPEKQLQPVPQPAIVPLPVPENPAKKAEHPVPVMPGPQPPQSTPAPAIPAPVASLQNAQQAQLSTPSTSNNTNNNIAETIPNSNNGNTPSETTNNPGNTNNNGNTADGADECKICFEAPINSVLTPCGHFALCYECATQIKKKTKKCPICRKTVRSVVQTYKA